MASAKEPDCFTCEEGPERIDHSDRDDAIEDQLDSLLAPGMTAADVQKVLPETVTVYGYAHQEISERTKHSLAERVLEDLFEWIDDEYGDPDAGGTEPGEDERAAARSFVDAITKNYFVWTCDQVSDEEVDVMAWVKEHRPDWLE